MSTGIDSLSRAPRRRSHPRSGVSRSPRSLLIIGVGLVLLVVGLLYKHAVAGVNDVALTAMPKGVSVVPATAASYQPSRRYVGTVEPWIEAKIGPQLVSAYVDTVLVRPGATVKRGEVIATLDCRNASAIEKGVAMQARAVAAQQAASASEAARIGGLLKGGFVSQNEVDQKEADSASKAAQVLSLQAEAVGRGIEVQDCVLRAPFDGEIGERHVDPGSICAARDANRSRRWSDRHIGEDRGRRSGAMTSRRSDRARWSGSTSWPRTRTSTRRSRAAHRRPIRARAPRTSRSTSTTRRASSRSGRLRRSRSRSARPCRPPPSR